MPHWTTRWLGWARSSFLGSTRPRAVAASVGYEAAGTTRWDAPVPWTADAAVLDVQLQAPAHARQKADFALRLPNATFPADSLRVAADDKVHVTFRFPVPPDTVSGDLVWKGRVIATVPVRVLTPATFLASVSLSEPTVAVRFGATTVAANAVVPDRCDGLLASAVLRCPTGLAPVAELGLRVVFHDSRSGAEFVAPVALGAAKLSRAEALVTAACPEVPQPAGPWGVTWLVGDRTLATQRLQTIPAEKFDLGVRVLEIRFAVLEPSGSTRTTKLPPVLSDTGRVGPCFVLTGSEPGAAAVCHFEVVAFASGGPDPGIRCWASSVVTDGPTVFVPALFDVAGLSRVSGFELRLNDRVLAVASLRPVPAARIDSEGGFVPPPEFTWSPAADDELADRLRRLQ